MRQHATSPTEFADERQPNTGRITTTLHRALRLLPHQTCECGQPALVLRRGAGEPHRYLGRACDGWQTALRRFRQMKNF
jgi:hypothetical protein